MIYKDITYEEIVALATKLGVVLTKNEIKETLIYSNSIALASPQVAAQTWIDYIVKVKKRLEEKERGLK